MDINVNVKLEAPEIMAALLAVAEALPRLHTEGRSLSFNRGQASQIVIEEVKPKEPVKTVTIEQVRAKLAPLIQAGQEEAVRGFIGKFGVSKLTEVAEEHYEELLKEAEKLSLN